MEEYIISTTIQVPSDQPLVACIGYFDGFHLGHQNLFNVTHHTADQHNYKSAIISFDPDPWTILKPTEIVRHLTSLDDRKALARQMGFDVWISLKFDEAMAHMEPQVFIDLLQRMNIQTLVCGFDFHFGNRGLGGTSDLLSAQTDQFKVIVVEAVEYQHEKISTTKIKDAIERGEVELASRLLGRPYGLKGQVVGGRQIGRKIGYPTANLKVNSEYVIPKLGVYSGFVEIEGLRYSCMIGIGFNPTVTDEKIVSFEAHIFDFDRDIYNLDVSFILMHYVRGEIKFNSLEALIEQLKQDEIDCRRLNARDLSQ